MTPAPTGKLARTARGLDLTLERRFRAPIDDVWASLTEPERTARWYGPWKGDPAPGRTIQVQMAYEEDTPWSDVRIEACDPPRHLELVMVDAPGEWPIVLSLSERDGITELAFTQHLSPDTPVGEIGPGWEYYLDMFSAAHDGGSQPSFDDYYPAQKDHYERLVP